AQPPRWAAREPPRTRQPREPPAADAEGRSTKRAGGAVQRGGSRSATRSRDEDAPASGSAAASPRFAPAHTPRLPGGQAVGTASNARGDPLEKPCDDVVAIDLVEHFVPAAGVEIVRQVLNAGCAIPLDYAPDSGESLADQVLASREQIHGQVAPYA